MTMLKLAALVGLAVALLAPAVADAQAPYGPPITLEQAKKAMVAAEAEAQKNKWNVVITILDSGGNVVMVHRLDNTQFGSVEVARQKAHAAVAFRRPTKVFQDLIAQGGVHLRMLNLTNDAGVLEGGVPVIADGKVVGAIGVSGVTSQQDAQIAQAGVDALK